MNDQTRAFAKKFAERNRGIHPTMIHAGVYAAVTALPEGGGGAQDATTAPR